MNNALRNRGVLVLSCVLVALGSLLCVGKESSAKPPEQAPKPGGHATSQQPPSPQPTSHQPAARPNADHRAPAAQPEPARREPVDRSQSSRPTEQRPAEQRAVGQRPAEQRAAEQRPTERAAPAGRRGPAQGQPAEPPGKQVAPHEKPAHAQGPAHEPPGWREPGPRKPVGPDPARHHPRPEKVDRGHLPRQVHERPAPKTTPHHPQANESTGQQKGAGSLDQPGKPASPPGKEKVHPKGKSSVAPPEQAPQRPEHVMAAGPKPEMKAGIGASKAVTPEENGHVYRSPVHAGTSANVSDGRSPGMGTNVPHDHKAPVQTLAGHKTGSDTRPGADPSNRQDRSEGGGISGPRSMDLRREEPTGLAGSSSAHPPVRQAVRSSQTVDPLRGRDAVPAAPPGGKQRPAGEQGQITPGTPFRSTKFLLDPLWDERSSLVDLTDEALRSLSGEPRELNTGTLHRGSLSQRGSPLEIPQPFSGLVPMMGGAAIGAGSPGNGAAPLLAVIAPCLIAVLYRGRLRTFCAFLRPGTVPRPALERPG